MKKIRRIFACIMMTILTMSLPLNYALAADSPETVDLYEINYEETVSVNNETFLLYYFYDECGKRCIQVENMYVGCIEVVVYDEIGGCLYYNDNEVEMSTLEANRNQNAHSVQTSVNDDMWLYLGHTDQSMKIFTSQVVVLAAAIAAIISPYTTAAAVIAAVSTAVLDQIISEFEDIIIGVDSYMYNPPIITQYKYVFALTPSGHSPYGPYVHVTPILW